MVVESPIHDDDPAAGAGPEGDDRQHDRQPVGLHDLDERAEPDSVQNEGHGAHRGIEHEEPEHDAGRPRQRAGDVVDEAHAGRQPPNADGVHDNGEQHHQHDEAGEPDDQVEADVFDGRQEAKILEHLGKVVEARKGAALGECKVDGIERRQHAEAQQEHSVEAGERNSNPAPGRARRWRNCAARPVWGGQRLDERAHVRVLRLGVRQLS